ncbi:MAG: AAA family ATPase [bacterium]
MKPPILILFNGAPGSGKTTIGEILAEKLECPLIDFGELRVFHLKPDWSDESPEESAMAFENLVFIIRNYFRHGYRYVITDDLTVLQVEKLGEVFAEIFCLTVTLVVEEAELRRRVGARTEGFTDVERSAASNRVLKTRTPGPQELMLDTSESSPAEAVTTIVRSLDIEIA